MASRDTTPCRLKVAIALFACLLPYSFTVPHPLPARRPGMSFNSIHQQFGKVSNSHWPGIRPASPLFRKETLLGRSREAALGSSGFLNESLQELNIESRRKNNLRDSQFHRQPNHSLPPNYLGFGRAKPTRSTFSSIAPDGSATPFSISIDGRKFYGGLIAYSHKLHPARICRVMNGCIRDDETLVLPQWMQRHDNTLKFQCGYPNIEFSLPDNEAPSKLRNLDLVGIKSLRPSMPDFISDFLPSAVVFDLVYGDHEASQSCHSRKGKDCDSFPGLHDGFRPAVILHPRLRSLAHKKCWVRQVVKLMTPPHSIRKTDIIYEDSLDGGEGEGDMTCFRSVLFTRGPFNRNLIMKDHLRRIHFLRANGVVKEARDVLSQHDSSNMGQICSLNVTITNRKRVDKADNRLIGRYMTNIPDIKWAILERAKKFPRLRLNFISLSLEGKSLKWQMNAMQKTDIWIAGHGPLLTNMIFLREKSSVLEVQPFAYYPQTYEKLADRLAHVSYERYIADPDIEAFRNCIDQMYGDEHSARKEAFKLLDRYMRAAKKYFASDSTHTVVLHTLEKEDLLQVKKCAEMQRLTTNARNFAVAVVRHARLRCGFPKPGEDIKVANPNLID